MPKWEHVCRNCGHPIQYVKKHDAWMHWDGHYCDGFNVADPQGT